MSNEHSPTSKTELATIGTILDERSIPRAMTSTGLSEAELIRTCAETIEMLCEVLYETKISHQNSINSFGRVHTKLGQTIGEWDLIGAEVGQKF